MYVCVYLCISTVHIFICIFKCVLLYTHVLYTWISIYMCVSMCVTCEYMPICLCVCMHVCACICICMYAYTHIKWEEIHIRCSICICSALQVDFMLIKVLSCDIFLLEFTHIEFSAILVEFNLAPLPLNFYGPARIHRPNLRAVFCSVQDSL